MTQEIKKLLEEIGNNSIFNTYPLCFIGGTALSTYLDHRISYDIDIASLEPLPVSAIKAFAFSIKARHIPDMKRASAFRINSGKSLDPFYMRFMVNGVKLEFVHFEDALRQSILTNAKVIPYSDNSTLKILSLGDIISLKAIALFDRQKSRDLFDMAILLERNLVSIDELERIYSFKQKKGETLLEYIQSFDSKKDDEGDTSLDFLPHQTHYKAFSKLTQDERFDKCKDMFITQYEDKQKIKLDNKQKEVKLTSRRNKRRR